MIISYCVYGRTGVNVGEGFGIDGVYELESQSTGRKEYVRCQRSSIEVRTPVIGSFGQYWTPFL